MSDRNDLRQRVLYAFGHIGGGIYDGFNTAIISLYVLTFTQNPFIVGYLSSSKTMEGVVVQPLVGRWSDRTRSRLGRRKPFILVAAPLSALFLLLAVRSGHVGGSLALPLVAVCIILFSLVYNVAGDPYDALMVDITPPSSRATFNAILNVVSLLGFLAITLYTSVVSVKKGSVPDSVFYITAAAIVLSYAVVLVGVREPKNAEREASRENQIPLRAYAGEFRTFTEAFKFLLADFCFWNGIFSILTFLNQFMKEEIGLTDSQALRVFAVLVLMGGICNYPAARLGTRIGYKPVCIGGCTILIVAALIGFVVPSYGWLFALAAVAGAGYGTVNALLYPYLASLVPQSKIGAFTGVRTSFSAAATPISIGITSLLISQFGLRSIFFVVGIAMVGAIYMFSQVDADLAERQVEDVVAMDRAIAGAVTAPAPAN